MANDDALLVMAMPFVQQLQHAAHGEKGAIVARACASLQVSAQGFYRLAQRVAGERERKKRADAGQLALSYQQCLVVSAYLMSSFRKNGKQVASMTKTLDVLRANGTVRLERVVSTTGEVVELSDSTIARSLRHYGLHPEQLTRPTPYVHLNSPHANWCWQMDASVCVIYYLPKGGALIREMKESEFYAGKPENWNRIAGQMVIRYLMTEHRWGLMRLHYVHGAESGDNACDHLIRTLAEPADPRGMLWGKPVHLMVDPGSAQVGRKFKRLCRRLGIKLIVNKAGNPRAKGQVENGHNLVERDFEHGLKLLSREIRGIDDLNRLADFWQRHFNCNAIHTRYGRDRYSAWAEDVAGYLIAPPPEAVMRDLATNDPEPRKVQGDLSVSWSGRRYYVGDVPDIRIGEEVMVLVNPWRQGELALIREDDFGGELQFPLREMVRDLATNGPEPREVQGDLSVSWSGRRYYVGDVPDIRIGEEVMVLVNPWRQGELALIREDDFGGDLQFPLREMVRDEAGQYLEHGATIGLDYQAPLDTTLDANRKAVTKLIAGETQLKAAEAKLKRKGVIPLDAFGIDPLIEARRADIPSLTPAAQPIAGVPLPVMMLSMVRAARLIRDGLGRDLTDDEFGWIRQRWADGVPENQVTGLIAQFSRAPGGTDAPAAAASIERVA